MKALCTCRYMLVGYDRDGLVTGSGAGCELQARGSVLTKRVNAPSLRPSRLSIVYTLQTSLVYLSTRAGKITAERKSTPVERRSL